MNALKDVNLFSGYDRRDFLKVTAGGIALLTGGLLLPKEAKAASFVASNSMLSILSKATTAYSSGVTYLRHVDATGLPNLRSVSLTGKSAGARCGESDQCVSLVKAMGAPQTSLWRRGRKVVGGNLQRGTLIAKFEADLKYSQTGAGHCCVLVGLRSTGGFDCWDMNWGSPSIIKRHAINGTGGGVNDPAAYYEIIA